MDNRDFPRKLYVELSSKCNLDCRGCFRQAWRSAPLDMAGGLLDKLVGEAAGHPVLETVVLGGIGEPGCSPHFGRALEAFSHKKVVVTTNAVDLAPEAVQALARHAALVVISVDGLGQTLRQLRGCSLDDIVATIKSLQAAARACRSPAANRINAANEVKTAALREAPRPGKGPLEIVLQMVLSSRNAADACGVVALAGSLGIGRVIVSQLLPQTAEGADEILYGRYARPETKALYDRLLSTAYRQGIRLDLPRLELKTERRCAFAEDGACFVTAEGGVAPCYRFAHDGREFVLGREKEVFAHSFGSLTEQSLAAIWQARSYSAFREALLANRYPSCPDCDLLDCCNIAGDSTADCWSGSPSCADCLWARGFLKCI